MASGDENLGAMGKEKEDLTGIEELSEALSQEEQKEGSKEGEGDEHSTSSGSTASEGAFDEALIQETPIETIEDFESLETFSQSSQSHDASSSELSTEGEAPALDPFASESSETTFEPSEPISESPEAISEAISESMGSPLEEPVAGIESATPPSPPSPSGSTPPSTIESVRTFSENLKPGKPAVAAEFPFSLMIIGPLTAHEKAKLLDLISSEDFGIRELELEPQLAAGRVLLPRISEYAGIRIIQALRSTQAKIRFGPSDAIFSTEDTREESPTPSTTSPSSSTFYSSEVEHPAESLPLTSASSIPGVSNIALIDLITATALLNTRVVEAESSAEYLEITEALQREIKYKTFRKGGNAVTEFKIQIQYLSSPAQYRLVATGNAVRI